MNTDRPPIGADLTYENAPRIATYRAIVDVGQHNWERMEDADQNDRVAHHLQRLWRIIDDAHRARMRVERAEQRRQQKEAA